MPVTLQFEASPVVGRSREKPAASADDLLLPCDRGRRVLSSSVSDVGADTLSSLKNGFVCTVLHAWQQDLHLELRPDDVWLAVLTQFGFYVRGGDESRAEALRDRFVAHRDRRELEINHPLGRMSDMNLPVLVRQFVGLVREQLVDPTLVDWLLPVFSTTQPDDEVAAAAVFLGTVHEYFGYNVQLGCGFPSVTLHGERKDWVDLSSRISRLADFDIASCTSKDDARAVTSQPQDSSAKEWSQALAVVADFMVASFDRPRAADVEHFWQRACHSTAAQASGDFEKMSGWLTAFCWWRSDGARLEAWSDSESTRRLWLKLGDVEFPVIDQSRIPPAVMRTDINFILDDCQRVAATLVGGSWGTKWLDKCGSRVRPFPGWWLVTGESSSQRAWREREKTPPEELSYPFFPKHRCTKARLLAKEKEAPLATNSAAFAAIAKARRERTRALNARPPVPPRLHGAVAENQALQDGKDIEHPV
ncbi:hypothetical protein A9K55_005456 [Cordyceps militaris]|uniref:Uncharacterized protein n=1 Tax=Cordyceps militaris TaxID=73501 RepID=A0A2H4SBR6_CORMI|nr:hypothetical protein A9K55_005456 [Cordyceps militaris]